MYGKSKVVESNGDDTSAKPSRLTLVPQLLTGNSVLLDEIMLQRQRELEEEKRLEDKRLANINALDSEASPDNLPVSDTPQVAGDGGGVVTTEGGVEADISAGQSVSSQGHLPC